MSKRPFSKMHQPNDQKGMDPILGLTEEQSAMSEKELVLQLRSLLEISRHELNYAAKEIHDNLGHLSNLVHIHLKLLLETPETERQNKVREISTLVKELNQEIRQLSINLTAASTAPEALDKLLLREIHRLKKLNLFQLVYIEPDHWPQLAGWKHLVLFRMVQEILTNVLKHSQANLVQVEVSQTGSFLNIQLKDNGIGYDPTQKPEKPHLGIRHLHDRARSINAQLQVSSRQQEGTSVHIRMPLS